MRRRASGRRGLVERAELAADEEALVDDRAARERDDVEVVEAAGRAEPRPRSRGGQQQARLERERPTRAARPRPRTTTTCSIAGDARERGRAEDRRSTGTPRQPSGRAPPARSASSTTRRADAPRAPRRPAGTACRRRSRARSARRRGARFVDDPSRRPASGSVMPAPSPVFASAAIAPRCVRRAAPRGRAAGSAAMGQPATRRRSPTPHASWSNRGSYRGAGAPDRGREPAIGAGSDRRRRATRRALVSVPGSTQLPRTRGAPWRAAWAVAACAGARVGSATRR